MEQYRHFIDRFYAATNKIDGLYYVAARRLGVNENTLVVFYSLADGVPRSQKQLSQELLIPKTTINTVVQEQIRAGHVQLVRGTHSKEKEIVLTAQGRDYARQLLRPLYAAEQQAMEQTLEQFSPEFLQAVEALTEHLQQAFLSALPDRKET